ncbi:MAG: hypothetical protein KMY54_09565, partial [Erysipelothrix sp.]|nr:hypothetical protein [Erysipelothrix sp.]
SLVTTGILVVLFMSIYKHFYAFAFGSYSVAISQSNFDMRFVSTTLQAYLFGTQNVALAIKMNESLNLSILNLLYDFGRSVFGLSFLLKDRLEITSQLFNTFIYGKTTATGHVISGIGYGYIYLGALFSPAIVWLNIFISVKLEKWLKSTKSYEMMYIVGYILIRFTTNLFATTPPLISSATIMFFSAGLVYYISKRLNFQISSVPSLSINNVSKRIIVKRGGT